MKPSEVRRLVESARSALEDPRTAPNAFILAYVAWEAFQVRLLVVGLASEGNTVSEARARIKAEQVWAVSNREKLFREIFGSNPSNTRGLGRYFNKVKSITQLRNRYIHGFGRAHPDAFIEGTEVILQVIESDWATPLRKLLKNKPVRLASYDPLGTVRRLRA